MSKYQSSVDWHKAKASGISFAFIKATEGGDRIDDYFAEHWRGTKAAGVPRSAYHFYYFCRPAAEQARWFIRMCPRPLRAAAGARHGVEPPIADLQAQARRCDGAQRDEDFPDIVEKHYGKKPIIYTSIDFFDDNGLSAFTGYPYWLRSVAGHPSEKYGGHPFTFWQYTGTGVVPGIKGNADINVFNGDMSAWKKWLKANTA